MSHHLTVIKAIHPEAIIMSISIDANGECMLLAAWCCGVGQLDSCEWFLGCLQCCLSVIVREKCTFVLDQDKGLLGAERRFGSEMDVAWCTYHLRVNFPEKFRRKLELFFPAGDAGGGREGL